MWSEEQIKKGQKFCKTKKAKGWKSMNRTSRVYGYCARVQKEKKLGSKRKSKKSKITKRKSKKKSRR